MVVIVAEIMGVLFLGGLSFKIFTFVISVVVGFVFWMIIDTRGAAESLHTGILGLPSTCSTRLTSCRTP
mgnify:CR=1 FL=1